MGLANTNHFEPHFQKHILVTLVYQVPLQQHQQRNTHTHTHKQTNKQTSKQTNKQTTNAHTLYGLMQHACSRVGPGFRTSGAAGAAPVAAGGGAARVGGDPEPRGFFQRPCGRNPFRTNDSVYCLLVQVHWFSWRILRKPRFLILFPEKSPKKQMLARMV